MPPPCPKRACSGSKLRSLEEAVDVAWESLPEGVVQLIGWRVLSGDLLDYIRFRAVCTHWNRSAVRPGGRGLLDPRFHPRRWMMLPEGHGLYPGHPALGGHVRFLNLSTGALVRVYLPLFHDHVVVDSTDGLLLLLRHCAPQDTTVRLLHPFTGDIADLPPLSSLLPQMESYRNISEDCKLRTLRGLLREVSAAVTVDTAAGAITVVLALQIKLLVAHATTGHRQWTLSAHKFIGGPTVPFHGKLYSVTPKSVKRNSVCVWQIDPPQPEGGLSLPPPRVIAHCPLFAAPGTAHLVECGSELMLVGFKDVKRTDLVVYRLADLIGGRFVPVTNIGEHALFLGSRPLYVSTQNKGLPSVVGNSITCAYRVTINNPQGGGPGLRLIEQYHLGSGTWSPAIDGDISCCNRLPASPYMLIHHILTCCHRSYWSKGVMFPNKMKPDWPVKPNMWIGGKSWFQCSPCTFSFVVGSRLFPSHKHCSNFIVVFL